MDRFLGSRLDKYEEWLKDGKISFSSKVVPVSQALGSKQWIMPIKQAMDHLKSARTFALTECVCRRNFRRCDNPSAGRAGTLHFFNNTCIVKTVNRDATLFQIDETDTYVVADNNVFFQSGGGTNHVYLHGSDQQDKISGANNWFTDGTLDTDSLSDSLFEPTPDSSISTTTITGQNTRQRSKTLCKASHFPRATS